MEKENIKKIEVREEISEKTVQINMKVIKEGKAKKFEDMLPKKEPVEEKKEEVKAAQFQLFRLFFIIYFLTYIYKPSKNR